MKHILLITLITSVLSCTKEKQYNTCGTVFEKRPTTYGCIVVVHYPDGTSKEFFDYQNDIVACNAINPGDQWCR